MPEIKQTTDERGFGLIHFTLNERLFPKNESLTQDFISRADGLGNTILMGEIQEGLPAWGAPGDTAYLILIGLNIEICFMFSIAGIVMYKTLPEDKSIRIMGIPNRWFIAISGSIFCVVVELFLNAVGALTWDWAWWNARAPWLIFLFGYMPFFVVAFWVHDMKTMRRRVATVATIYAFDAACIVIFGVMLGWI